MSMDSYSFVERLQDLGVEVPPNTLEITLRVVYGEPPLLTFKTLAPPEMAKACAEVAQGAGKVVVEQAAADKPPVTHGCSVCGASHATAEAARACCAERAADSTVLRQVGQGHV
jgi:hypothetical protein